jgi:hypothetical protein
MIDQTQDLSQTNDAPAHTEEPAAEQPSQAPTPMCPPLTRLDEARSLPEVGQDADTVPCAFVEGTIEAFKSNDDRTMRVVLLSGADGREGFASQEVVRASAGDAA